MNANYYMDLAIKEAKKGFHVNEVPVGVILVDDIKNKTVKDIWGKNDGEFVENPQIVDGKFGKALEFDGTDYVEMKKPSFIPSEESALTMEAWIKPSDAKNQLAQAGVLGWDLSLIHI